jgi:hypothetical protein
MAWLGRAGHFFFLSYFLSCHSFLSLHCIASHRIYFTLFNHHNPFSFVWVLGLGLGLLGLGCCEHHRFSCSCHVYESVAKDKNGVAGWLVGSQSVMFSCMFCVSGIGSVGFRDLGSEFVGYLPICLSAYLLTYLPTFTEGVGVGGGVIGVGGWVFLGVMDGFMAGWSGWLARGPGSKQHRPPFCAAEFHMRFDLAVFLSVFGSLCLCVSGFGYFGLFRWGYPFGCCIH